MKINKISSPRTKPKNYSRKGKICSCLCPIIYTEQSKMNQLIERVIIKYEVEPNKETHFSYIPKLKKNQWASYQYWGEFKRIVEIPEIFSKLDEEDYVVNVGSFNRDNIQMPFVTEILILNIEKYKILKTQEERRKKLEKIKNI